jgi:uncharacterized membrane protein HdeD (DUF308 family)
MIYPSRSSDRSSWTTVVQGLLAIVFGVVLLLWPRITLITLIYLFAAYALVDGMLALAGFLSHRQVADRGWWGIGSGLLGIGIGLVTLFWPSLTALVLLYLIAARAIFLGVLQILDTLRWRQQIQGEWLPILGGVLGVAFGLIAFVMPRTGALALLWLIALYAIGMGVLWVVLGLRARTWRARST